MLIISNPFTCKILYCVKTTSYLHITWQQINISKFYNVVVQPQSLPPLIHSNRMLGIFFLVLCAHSCHSLIISFYHFIVRLSSVSYFDVGFFLFRVSILNWCLIRKRVWLVSYRIGQTYKKPLYTHTRDARTLWTFVDQRTKWKFNRKNIWALCQMICLELISVRWRMQQVVSSVFI